MFDSLVAPHFYCLPTLPSQSLLLSRLLCGLYLVWLRKRGGRPCPGVCRAGCRLVKKNYRLRWGAQVRPKGSSIPIFVKVGYLTKWKKKKKKSINMHTVKVSKNWTEVDNIWLPMPEEMKGLCGKGRLISLVQLGHLQLSTDTTSLGHSIPGWFLWRCGILLNLLQPSSIRLLHPAISQPESTMTCNLTTHASEAWQE